MSDDPSIRNHRITKTNFRSCSTDKSRSQAPFYLYARCLIANQAEGTFVLLRYSLGMRVRLAGGTLYRICEIMNGSINSTSRS